MILLNTLTVYRNTCCTEYLESLLEHPNHSIHIIKQLCFTFICFYIFHFAHSQVLLCVDNTAELLGYLFEDNKIAPDADYVHDLNDEHLNDQLENQIYQLNSMKVIKTDENHDDNRIYNSTILQSNQHNTCSFLSNSKPNLRKYTFCIVICFILICSIKLLVFSQTNLINIWSVSILALNLMVLIIILIINYFPYQVMAYSKYNNYKYSLFKTNTSKNATKDTKNFCSNLRNKFEASQPHQALDENDLENDCDEKLIEMAFREYKQELKLKALSNRDLNFGSNQPSMNSGYQAVIGLIIFFTCSITSSLILGFLFFQTHTSHKEIIFALIFLLVVTYLQLFFSLKFLVRNNKETVYIDHLYYKSPLLPWPQLILIYMNIFFILNSETQAIWGLFVEFISCFFVLITVYKLIHCIRERRTTQRESASNGSKRSGIFLIIGQDENMRVSNELSNTNS